MSIGDRIQSVLELARGPLASVARPGAPAEEGVELAVRLYSSEPTGKPLAPHRFQLALSPALAREFVRQADAVATISARCSRPCALRIERELGTYYRVDAASDGTTWVEEVVPQRRFLLIEPNGVRWSAQLNDRLIGVTARVDLALLLRIAGPTLRLRP